MKNILRLTLLLLLVTSGVLEKVEITNRTELPIKVEISLLELVLRIDQMKLSLRRRHVLKGSSKYQDGI